MNNLLSSISLHIGENRFGHNFGDAYSRFDVDVVPAYTDFLDDLYGKFTGGAKFS
jgi:hypothetical protein